MREIEVNGETFRVRGLLRREIKELRKRGFILLDLQPSNAEEAQEAVFELIFSEEELDKIYGMQNRDVLRLWEAVISETYEPDLASIEEQAA